MDWKTTFWMDFSIADRFGISAIKDTYKRAFEAWKDNTEYVTELVMVLNWKVWHWYKKKNSAYQKVYDDLFYKTRDWCLDNLKGEDLSYFLRVTD